MGRHFSFSLIVISDVAHLFCFAADSLELVVIVSFQLPCTCLRLILGEQAKHGAQETAHVKNTCHSISIRRNNVTSSARIFSRSNGLEIQLECKAIRLCLSRLFFFRLGGGSIKFERLIIDASDRL